MENFETAFTHNYETDCPVSSCQFMEPGCGSALAAQSNVYLTSATTGQVKAKRNVGLGYTVSFCYRCIVDPVSGEADKVFDKNSLAIVQYADCSDALVPKSFSIPVIQFLSGGADVEKMENFETAFTHNKQTDCPVNSCQLMETGCGSALAAQTNVILTSAATGQVKAKRNVGSGYTVSFCYRC